MQLELITFLVLCQNMKYLLVTNTSYQSWAIVLCQQKNNANLPLWQVRIFSSELVEDFNDARKLFATHTLAGVYYMWMHLIGHVY